MNAGKQPVAALARANEVRRRRYELLGTAHLTDPARAADLLLADPTDAALAGMLVRDFVLHVRRIGVSRGDRILARLGVGHGLTLAALSASRRRQLAEAILGRGGARHAA